MFPFKREIIRPRLSIQIHKHTGSLCFFRPSRSPSSFLRERTPATHAPRWEEAGLHTMGEAGLHTTLGLFFKDSPPPSAFDLWAGSPRSLARTGLYISTGNPAEGGGAVCFRRKIKRKNKASSA
ncbi:UNVERIFIED_CONTAM: hypothetical protein K2H54_007012 [Gekko kuhli]